jgi:hypothetical protein
MVIRTVAGSVAFTWLANMVVLFSECRPIHLAWQVLPNTPRCAKAASSLSHLLFQN